ncbi:MAG: NAD(P)/FAD-dependent oxidoreductase [Gemmatimonadota bacterium]|nr:MAG: NAD(P)/FAD-dependent oxidoreductase [Gemmatimonadota bacterium]
MVSELERGISRKDFLKLVAASTAALAIDPRQLDAMAAELGSKQLLPVIVIGGGLGGLSAAAHLARRGFPVTLVEQHIKPGGYATTFQRGPFDFDVSLHQTASAQGGLRATLESAGILDKVETVETPELCRIITLDHDLSWPQRDPEAIVEQLVQLFPGEEDGIRDFFGVMAGILEEGLREFDPDSWWNRVTFPLTHRKMWGVRNKTLADVLDEHVQDARARSILSAFWHYYGLPPSRLSAFYYCIATAGYLRFGGHYIRDRSQDLSNALMEAIESAGGTVMLGTKASSITTEDGAVSGVTLSDGRQLEAQAVISNASVPATMEMLGAGAIRTDEQREYLERLASYRPSLSNFGVWLGLNREIRGAVAGYEIFVQSGYDPEKAYEACLACDPAESDIGVTVYDNAFEGYSRPGTSTIAVLMLSGYEPWRKYEADYFAGRKDAYNAEKERIAATLIRRAEERVIPGLSSMIEVIEIGTPLTNLRYTGNPEGAIYGYEQSLANAFMTRLTNTPPFEGLYFASAWTNPGGGYQPCLQSGVTAAQSLMRDREVEA